MNYQSYMQAAECLKTISHPHRLKMIKLLLEKNRSVGDLAKSCRIKHNVASEHLTVMKDRNLLTSEKDGRKVIYKIKEKLLSKIIQCIEGKFS
jgi:DNA-binding transcriptional ArsR family regulator